MPIQPSAQPGAAQSISPQPQGTPYNPAANYWTHGNPYNFQPVNWAGQPQVQAQQQPGPRPRSYGAYRYGPHPELRAGITPQDQRPSIAPRPTAGVQGGAVDPRTGMWTPGMTSANRPKRGQPSNAPQKTYGTPPPKRADFGSDAEYAGAQYDYSIKMGQRNALVGTGGMPTREAYVAANSVSPQQRQAAEAEQRQAQLASDQASMQRAGVSADTAQWLLSGATTAPTAGMWDEVSARAGNIFTPMDFQSRVDIFNRRPARGAAMPKNFFDANSWNGGSLPGFTNLLIAKGNGTFGGQV